MESNTEALHQCFVDTVTEVNGKLRSLRGVHQIELLSSYSDLVENRKEIVAKLLSAEHVTDITLPDPSWMPDPSEIRDMQGGFKPEAQQG